MDQASHLSPEQSHLVSQFLEWTGASSEDTVHGSPHHGESGGDDDEESRQAMRDHAILTLARYQWDLQRALEDHLLLLHKEGPAANKVKAPERQSDTRSSRTTASPSQAQAQAQAQTRPVPRSESSSAAYFWLILQTLWQVLWLPLHYLLTEPCHVSSEQAALPYAEPLPRHLGISMRERDEEGSFSRLLSAASRRPLFYVVYIDSRHHVASAYSRSTLLHDARLIEFFGSSELLFYDLNVATYLGWHIALQLNLTAFPALAIVRHPARPMLVAVQALTLETRVESLLAWLQAEKRKLTERSAETRLREEQESAYLRSLAADRAKAEQRIKADAAKHLLATSLATKRAALESEKKAALASWQREAAKCSAEQKERQWQRLSLRLPSGRRIVLSLDLGSCSLLSLYGALYAQLSPEDELQGSRAQEEQDVAIWTLGSHYPRKSFALSSSNQSRSLLDMAISDGMTLYAESASLQERLEDDAMDAATAPPSPSSS